MAAEQVASEDAHLWKTEVRALLSGVNLAVLIAAIVAAVWGGSSTR